jgi:serine/threonine protein kinase
VSELQSYVMYDSLNATIGIVYHGIDIVSKHDVAIKLEVIDVEQAQVEHEYQVYKSLAGGIGIPAVHWFGTEQDYNVLVLERLGPSLKDLFNRSRASSACRLSYFWQIS